MSTNTQQFFQVVGMSLFVGTTGTLLGSLWYRVTQKEPLTWNSVSVFAKVFYGMGGAAVILYLVLKYT
jgi:hypothetical protein